MHNQQHPSNSTGRRNTTRRGSAMVEMVFAAPILLLFVVMIFFFGYMLTRQQRGNVMARYEVWRSTYSANGPSAYHEWDSPDQTWHHEELNWAFFQSRAQSITRSANHHWISKDPYDKAIQRTEDEFEETTTDMHKTWFYRDKPINRNAGSGSGDDDDDDDQGTDDDDANRRLNAGRHISFTIREKPILEAKAVTEHLGDPYGIGVRHRRIHRDWRFQYDPNACAYAPSPGPWAGRIPLNDWSRATGGGRFVHLARSVRDVFFWDLDSRLDTLDAEHDGGPHYEYWNSPTQTPNTHYYAGMIRSLFLYSPQYASPIVQPR